jgi:hypothetical protein
MLLHSPGCGDHGCRKDRMTRTCDAHRPILRRCSFGTGIPYTPDKKTPVKTRKISDSNAQVIKSGIISVQPGPDVTISRLRSPTANKRLPFMDSRHR